MARILGVNNLNEVTTIRALVSYIQFMNHEMGIPAHLSDMGIVSEGEYYAAIEEMAEGALIDNCTATNPRVPTKAEVIELFREIW
jgi:alcohol dehydrogenase class IV